MKTYLKIIILVASASVLYQCSDITEPNLSKNKYSIKLVSPADSVSTEIQNQTFIWEPIKGADKYQFQLAYPSFKNAQIVIVDTTISGTSFSYNFNFTGDYEWRVKAKNGSSETGYKTNRLHVTKVLSLSKQTLFIYGPVDSLYTNDATISISWKPISVAKQYIFTLQQKNSSGKYIIENDSTTKPPFILPVTGTTLSEGIYYWTLTAINDTAASTPVSRTFIIDRTGPTTPTLQYPKADTLIADTNSVKLIFTWLRTGTDVVYDSLYILDSNKTSVLFKAKSTSSSYSYPSPWSGTARYWKVLSFDKAGNSSLNPEIRKYTFKKK
jgi:hypothetical protein